MDLRNGKSWFWVSLFALCLALATASAAELACPKGSGFVPLSNLYSPRAVLVGYQASSGHLEFVHELAQILGTRFPGLDLEVLLPNQVAVESAREKYDPILRSLPHPENVHFIPSAHPVTIWAQDFLSIGIDGPIRRPEILTLPHDWLSADDLGARAAREKSNQELAQDCGVEVKEAPVYASVAEAGDYGGNIMAFPGGVIVVGNDMVPAMRDDLARSTETDPVVIDTAWLEVGHVDEMFSVVRGRNPAPCDFTILYASPALGLELAKLAAAQDPNTPLEPEDPAGIARYRGYPAPGSSCLSSLPRAAYDRPLPAGLALQCEDFVAGNQYYEKVIQQSLKKVVSAVAKATGCQNPKTQALPMLYVLEPLYFDTVHPDFTQEPGTAIAVSPNPVNALVLGDVMVLGKQPNSLLQNFVEQALRSNSITPEFVDSRYLHFRFGNVHCGTNAIRSCQ